MKIEWPKKITEWSEGDSGYLSIPFTWLLPAAQERIDQRDMFVKRWVVGGPAVRLMPDYLKRCRIGEDSPGVLQRVNPAATRTTLGCPNRCGFCGVSRIEGGFRELSDWPTGNILCDNNILAASREHLVKVGAMLRDYEWCDFNQGLDAGLLDEWRAMWLAGLPKPIVRLACDSDSSRKDWQKAFSLLRAVGVPKSRIRTYVLIGWRGTPEQDWDRCDWIEGHGVKALPMWFHKLDALKYGVVTKEQESRGWTKELQRQIMRWYDKHSGSKLVS